MSRIKYTQKAKRWVIKIGSALLTKDGKGLDYDAINNWTKEMVQLRQQGIEIILVSSGSVAEGMSRMGWTKRPTELAELQAAAAIGQTGLIEAYETQFKKHHIQAAQILLTHDDVSNRKRYLNARNTLRALLKFKALPIINENDTVALEEMRLGDNDTLAALVANITEAELLVILTDQQGLFDKDPRHNSDAKLITEERAGNKKLHEYVGEIKTSLGSGGMSTKLTAAQRAARSGCATIIASGREEKVLGRIANGEIIGTLLTPDDSHFSAKKQWIAGQVQASGAVYLDAGASKAIQTQGTSLLPIGVIKSEGHFKRGDVVDCKNQSDQVIARGLINYSDKEVSLLAQKPSNKIGSILGYTGESELIHRDNLVVL
ncbi:glutamate 5-kinase [Cocleimonas sp. KMM 6892]|uniref:glutamate 5-kinase n=1 Tax=unclassified Cocleimonas TaxID=2639732 RepID=UPI002DBF814C|nr:MULTISPECIES: glutamate 5-kinase [unclassified Cocleimonas]MEB8431295.1 glutamate 5-kinase [Cocleimonas sp. KMM 6892]MEC4713933.1 glutamate 5-kinase [Cocleimonas sp. KMM 6895]MEC4743264.1 glutamate 5-kinase [Cocleimonas sp. KMM 6896]